ncbi:hypothetical protein [Vannielia sp.]|uniref:hypothetical protein n=1 Tax=Vannielia sp. TaxID=2813045 RepID=UPI00260EFCB1|nr:hypothetical protein [Vannielia sp.]MDF1871040.1 hypothetical protein [Vannielia sp.]
MKKFVAAAALLFLTLPARAAPLPQGDYLLSTHLWTSAILPYYIRLHVEGDRAELHYFTTRALNWKECKKTGDCIYDAVLLDAKADVSNGRLALSNITYGDATLLEDKAEERYGLAAQTIYVAPVLTFLEGAAIRESEAGFTATGAGPALEFLAVPEGAWEQLSSWTSHAEFSIAEMAGCEVKALAALIANPNPSSGEARYQHVLKGMVVQGHLFKEMLRLAGGTPSMADREAALEANLLSMFTIGAYGRYKDAPLPSEQQIIEDNWPGFGKKVFGTRKAYEAAIASYNGHFYPLVQYLRFMSEREPTVADACADPSFGFIAAGN